MNRPLLSKPLVLLLFTITWQGFSPVRAVTFEHGENIHITNLHTVSDLFAWSQGSVKIDGTVQGDAYIGFVNATIDGRVDNSVIVLATGDFRHGGAVGGTITGFASRASIDGFVGRSVVLAGMDVRIGKQAEVDEDVFIAATAAHIDGTVAQNVTINADEAFISGIIGGNLYVDAKKISLAPGTMIDGDFTYCCPSEISLDTLDGVSIFGDVKMEEIKEPDESGEEDAGTIVVIAKIIAAFVFAVILLTVFRQYGDAAFQSLQTRMPLSLGVGFLTVLIVGCAVVLLLISSIFVIVGWYLVSGDTAPLGALILATSIVLVPITSFAAVSGGILFYSGKVLLAALVGFWLVRRIRRHAVPMTRWQLLVGLIVMYALFEIDYFGNLVYFLTAVTGAGAIILGVRDCQERGSFALPLSGPSEPPPDVTPPPPPPRVDRPLPPAEPPPPAPPPSWPRSSGDT